MTSPQNNNPQKQFNYAPALEELAQLFGSRLKTEHAVCEQYGKDESFHPSVPPHAVIQPENATEVQSIVKICNRNKTPIIPHGAGTSLEGNIAALSGGICIDSAMMNAIISVNHGDFDALVQPGVTRRQLNQHLKNSGLFFPIDPGADATLGGMAATRASGTNAVRYGSMRENVVNIEAVMADGSIIQTAKRSRKSAAGYDLTRLMVGSEGTLGFFTALTVKLYPLPEAISAAVCTFENMGGAVNTVIEMIQYGIPVARVELLDGLTLKAINRYSSTEYTEAPTLFFEFHGSQQGVQEQARLTQEIADQNQGSQFKWTSNTEQRNKMWRARHDVAWACKLLRPDGQIWSTDVCVPISRLAECIDQTRKDIEEAKILAPIAGHVGDGNFHLLLLVDHEDKDEIAAAETLHHKMVMRALEMDGTCTGEHGIGYGKIEFLKLEHGEAVQPMRLIKQALDPNNIFNPGKIFEWHRQF
ncbi:FAD-binding oxidoreductase [Candidatus Spongiihabitans sp.]|uniref:FAD-binding oxidoreductase n=1 Tax=Candidatus Spongiihabitans sp. TaxID=3101308 RepID=UPI003C7049CF